MLYQVQSNTQMKEYSLVYQLVALVQFGLLANIEPGGALLCFASVVVLTMLSAETFDPKLIWAANEKNKYKLETPLDD